MKALALTADDKLVFAKGRAHGSHTPGVMNDLETEYAWILEARKYGGEISEYWFESLTLMLAKNCKYTPDFLVMLPDGALECHEVKGEHIEEDSTIKLKMAAAKFPFRFWRCQKTKARGWVEKDYSA